VNGFKTALPKVMPCMSSRRVETTVPGAVRQTVRRTVFRLVAVSSEDHRKELSTGPCHNCLRIKVVQHAQGVFTSTPRACFIACLGRITPARLSKHEACVRRV